MRSGSGAEEEHLTTIFKQNGYPLPFIHAISSSLQKPTTSTDEELDEEEDSQEEEKQPLAVIPYVSGVSERPEELEEPEEPGEPAVRDDLDWSHSRP